jgi:hypothetical protein
VAQFAKGALITIKTIRASLGHKLIQGDDRHCREKVRGTMQIGQSR